MSDPEFRTRTDGDALKFYLKRGHDFTSASENACVRCGYHKNTIRQKNMWCGWTWNNRRERS